MPYDLLFTHARVLDGTVSPWFRADVAVADGRIVAIGHRLDGEAVRTIDVGGHALAPGFYDMHSHSDIALLVDPRHEPKVFQGVIFELLGQDGLSYAPVTSEIREQIRRHLAGLNGDDPRAGWDWTSVASFLDRFEQMTAVNVGYLMPHNAVRIGAMGWARRTATPAESRSVEPGTSGSPPARLLAVDRAAACHAAPCLDQPEPSATDGA